VTFGFAKVAIPNRVFFVGVRFVGTANGIATHVVEPEEFDLANLFRTSRIAVKI
tara:strand:+ start:405 stop:566 length:162 start_codon:yes stop_codon:yes gene_type:complete